MPLSRIPPVPSPINPLLKKSSYRSYPFHWTRPMPSTSKALPADIEHFFEGESTFFPSPSGLSLKADKSTAPVKSKMRRAIPERVNGRTPEQTHGATERSTMQTPEPVNGETADQP